jgi:hypothetical protein
MFGGRLSTCLLQSQLPPRDHRIQRASSRHFRSSQDLNVLQKQLERTSVRRRTNKPVVAERYDLCSVVSQRAVRIGRNTSPRVTYTQVSILRFSSHTNGIQIAMPGVRLILTSGSPDITVFAPSQGGSKQGIARVGPLNALPRRTRGD